MSEAAQFTGGCQCGAIRFALSAPPTRVSICHCRMCQKAVGGPFASYADVLKKDFRWTRGEPAAFQSSSRAMRDFCAECGTPLSYRLVDGSNIEIATGAFDQPGQVLPDLQFGMESRLAWVDDIAGMPGKTTLDNYGDAKLKTIVSHQHPDHA